MQSSIISLADVLGEYDLPPILWRSRWDEYRTKYGFPYSGKYMVTLDSQGKGPKSFVSGGMRVYRTNDFLEWLKGHDKTPIRTPPGRKHPTQAAV